MLLVGMAGMEPSRHVYSWPVSRTCVLSCMHETLMMRLAGHHV